MFFTYIIQQIKDFFFSLFFSSSDDYKLRKALRYLTVELKKAKYPLYRADNTVLPGLPIIIFELYSTILPIASLLKSTIASSDLRVSNWFIDCMVENIFSEHQKEMRMAIEFQNRYSNAVNLQSQIFDEKMKEQNKLFNDFLFYLTDPKFKATDITVNKIFSFFDFCEFKFNDFFAHFDSEFKSDESGKNMNSYNFQSVKGSDVLQDILDIDYLLKNIVVDEQFISALLFLNSKLPEKIRKDEYTVKKSIQNFIYIFENDLGKETLETLAKLIKQDPVFSDSTKIMQKQFRIVEEYKNRITGIFNADSKKLLKIHQEEQMASLIQKTFGTNEFKSLPVYNEDFNTRIQKISTLSFDWVKPIEMIHAYTKSFFEPFFEPFLRELIVDGFFEDKTFQSNLSADYYYCESIPEKIHDFENLTSEKSEYSSATINNYIDKLQNGIDHEKQLAKAVDFLNLKAKNLVEECGKHYINLYKASALIVKDSHKSVADYVSNLRAMIISTRCKEHFASFEEHLSIFENFIEILKHYIILEVPSLGGNEKTKE